MIDTAGLEPTASAREAHCHRVPVAVVRFQGWLSAQAPCGRDGMVDRPDGYSRHPARVAHCYRGLMAVSSIEVQDWPDTLPARWNDRHRRLKILLFPPLCALFSWRCGRSEFSGCDIGPTRCPRGGMVDTRDLKSLGRKAVPVRARPRVPILIWIGLTCSALGLQGVCILVSQLQSVSTADL